MQLYSIVLVYGVRARIIALPGFSTRWPDHYRVQYLGNPGGYGLVPPTDLVA